MTRPYVRRRYDETRLWAWMPFEGGSNRKWLMETLGERIRPEWNRPEGRWEIARPHLKALVAALVDRFEEVDVFLEFSTTERCHERCQEATGDDCSCSCMGENHGGAAYWKRWHLVGDQVLVGQAERVQRHYLVTMENLTSGWLR
ncbi:hypothetical protein [Streptomyces xiamenensis]|uniref:hypothetical protein n=1 Tax=Streptomyces xiamenensis TaxID=408015 RepID=UPI0037D136F5